MVHEFPIFKTRLIPPQGKQFILQRPQIGKKLRQIKDYPLTLIHSGPGYGKSTTLAAFLNGRKDACWYTLSEQDDDIVIFLYYFIHSVKMAVPAFGESLLVELDGNSRTSWIRSICSEMVNEFSGLDHSIIIVLDDFHLVEHSDSINEWLQMFIENIPSNVHLVISGRTRPQWPLITKLKAKSEILVIDEHHFAFSYEEIEVLFHDNYQMPLEPSQIQGILNLTEGWAMAIQLIAQQSKQKGTLDKILENRNRSLNDLFEYLTMEVLTKLDDKMRDFLKQTCIFEELHPPIIERVLNIPDAEKILNKIANANLFLTALNQGSYRYHALFRDFLISDLQVNDPVLLESLHRQAGRYYEEIENNEQAIYHYEMISDFPSAAKILNSYGRKMIQFGSLESLKEKLFLIPPDVKDMYLMLWVYEGEIYRYRCQYGQALECYNRAQVLAESSGQWEEQSSALEGIAQVFLDTIQPGKADKYLKKAVEVIPENEAVNERRARLTRLMAENLVNLGRAKEAVAWLNIRPGEAISNVNNEKLEPRLLLRMGRLEEAMDLLEIQKIQEQKEEGHLQQSHRETDLLLSLIYSFQGDALRAKTLAQEGIMRGVKYKAPFVEACGWMRIGHSVQISNQYDLNQAMICYKTALKLMDDIQMPRGKAEPLMGLCGVYAQKGEFETAIHYGELALEETDKVSDEWLSALIRLSLSNTYYYMGNYGRCLELLKDCERTFEACGDGYGLAVTYLWKTMISFQKEDWPSFKSHLLSCLKHVEDGRYEFILDRRTLLGPFDVQKIPQILHAASQRGISTPFTQSLMRKWKLTDERSHPGYTLHVQTLGQFRVWLGHLEVQPEAWQRSKAKELFQLFLTRRNTWVSKDDIIAWLWPDQDGPSGLSGFKVALNALNKVLEPERKARGTPYFIDRKGSLYRLNMAGIILDVDDFESTLQRASESVDVYDQIQLLETGLSYYKGDFLPERRFEDWCAEEREKAQLLFLRASEKCARLYISQKDFDRAIEHCERIINTDACWEEAYRMIMFCYYQMNNRPQAIKYYKKCYEQLERELGIRPLSATTNLYLQIIEGELLIE
ncbi:MAG: BTAD domain-containing putative transcriptional regulator [Tuberibacillus sp.]